MVPASLTGVTRRGQFSLPTGVAHVDHLVGVLRFINHFEELEAASVFSIGLS